MKLAIDYILSTKCFTGNFPLNFCIISVLSKRQHLSHVTLIKKNVFKFPISRKWKWKCGKFQIFVYSAKPVKKFQAFKENKIQLD